MTTRRDVLRTLAAPAVLRGAAPAARPNVVYIVADDYRSDLLSLRGHPFVRTPNIDRIGREGACFTNAFVTTSLCSPSRASFLTGRYAHQHKVYYNRSSETFDKSEATFPRLLHDAGYRTAYTGKWHIGNDARPRPGFDRWAVLPGQGIYRDPVLNVDGEQKKYPGHVDAIVGRFAAEFIENQDGKQPFCLCVGIKSPHAEQLPPDDLKSALEDVEIPKPPSWYEDFAASGKADVVTKSCFLAERFFDGPDQLKGGWQRYIKDFYRCSMSADRTVGAVLQALDRKGLAGNTLVIFAGDNGFFLGEHRLVDKRFPYEDALRIPLVMRQPGVIARESVIPRMTLNLDVCPTVLQACGVPVPRNVAGRALQPVLAGKPPANWRTEMFYEYAERIWGCPAIVAVRTERHKYIEYLDPASTNELYDLAIDSGEMRNLIREAGYSGVLRDMKARLARLERETGWQPPVAQGPNSPCPVRKTPVA